MKRALLIVGKNCEELQNVNEQTAEYCKKKGFDYIGIHALDEEEVLKDPEKAFKSLKQFEAEVVLSYDSIFFLGEFSSYKSLLSRIEEEGIECFDVVTDAETRRVVDKCKGDMFKELAEQKKIEIPVLVLYDGKFPFEKNQDFRDIKKYINDELNIEQFSVLGYSKEDDGLMISLIDIMKRQNPEYIIHNEPFTTEKMRLFTELIENYGLLETRIIDMDEVQQTLDKERNADIKVSRFLH